MNRWLIVAASDDLAAAKICVTQGPLAAVARGGLSVVQVVPLVPHQQARGSPWLMHGPGTVVPGCVAATKHTYRFSHSVRSAPVKAWQPSVPSKQLPVGPKVQAVQAGGTHSDGGVTDIATQVPAWHESPVEQVFPSSHEVPSGLLPLEQTPEAGSHIPAIWQVLAGGGQTTAVPGVQAPAWQVSVVVQALLSVQVVPFAAFGFEQTPVAGAQTPTTWHESSAVQTFAVPPVQVPAWQASPVVHALPSVQVAPLGAVGFEQLPLAGSQTPAMWH